MKPSELIEDRDSWTKGAMARDKDGKMVPVHSSDASCWCLWGAFMKCGLQICDYTEFMDDILCDTFSERFPSEFNDSPSTTHQNVIDVLQKHGL